MRISYSNLQDIEEILRLYKLATEYQKLKFPINQWPQFDLELIEREIFEKRQFKLVIEGKIACIWAISFSDPEIWEEKNVDPSIYIHRIATNPDFRGNDFVSKIVDWARGYAILNEKKYIRLDTCGYNERLIGHYKKSGFEFLRMKKLKDSTGLPKHYLNADVCFFQIELS